MINQFKRNQPNIILFYIFLSILLWLPLFIFMPEQKLINIQFSGVMEKFYLFLGNTFYFRNILSIVLVFAISFLLSRLNTTFLFINFRTQMPGFWFTLLTAPFIYVYDLFPVLVAALFLMFCLFRLFLSYDKKSLSFELIDAGFLVSLASLFYPPILFLHLFLFASLVALKGYSWKEWFLVILGGIIPIAIIWSISYTFDIEFQNAYSELLFKDVDLTKLNLGNIIFAISTGITLIIASFLMISVFSLKKISSRRFFSSLLILFITSFLLALVFSRITSIILVIIPVTYLFTHYFYLMKRRKIGNILFYLLISTVVFSIVNSLFPII